MQDAKRRAIIFAVLSLILAAAAGLLFMQRVGTVEAKLGAKVKVYVAKKDIPARQQLKPENFEAREVPKQFVQKSTVTNIKKIDQTVSAVPMKKGDLLTTNMLKPLAELSSNNKRMVALSQSNRVFFDQEPQPLDRVDIIVSRKQGERDVTDVMLRDVLVVAASKTKSEDEDNKKGSVNAIGLELDLDDAQQLIHAQNYAKSIRVLVAPQKKGSAIDSSGNTNNNKQATQRSAQQPGGKTAP